MEKIIETPALLKPYVQKLVSWQLICQVDSAEVDFRCYSDEIKKLHIMTIPLAYLRNLRHYLSGAVHEAVHFNYAERLSPLFSAARIAASMCEKFSVAQKTLDKKTIDEMNTDLQLMEMAHAILDVYINDGVTEVDRNLSLEDLKIFRDSVAEGALTQESFDFNFLGAFALHIALCERDGFGKEALPELTHREWIQSFINQIYPVAVYYHGSDRFMRDLENLSTFLITRPRVPKDKEGALKLLEETFNGFFEKVMQAPTRVRIVLEKREGMECHAWEHYRI